MAFAPLQLPFGLPPRFLPLPASSLQNAAQWLCGTSLYSKQIPSACMSCKVSQQLLSGGHAFWSSFLPGRFIYSSDLADVDTVQLSELWTKTLKSSREPQKIAKALEYSYAFVVVLEQGEVIESSGGFRKKLIGFGRAVSDGAFIATISDVAVDPNYQRRGIGRKIVKELVKNMKRRGGPTGFAVFPPPRARRFFWTIGFRPDKKFRFMTYRGRLIGQLLPDNSKRVAEGQQVYE